MFADANYQRSDLGFSDTFNNCTRNRGFKTAQKIPDTPPKPDSAPTEARIAASPQPVSAPTAAHVDAHHSPHDSHKTRFRILQQPKAKLSRPCNSQPDNPPANLRCAVAKPTLSLQGSRPLLARPRQGFRKTTASNC